MGKRRTDYTLHNWDIIVYCIGLSALAFFLIQRCKYGFGNMDEAFYLTIPYRFIQGDSIFLDEWHLSQMNGIILMPFVKIYLILHGNTDGIILAFRYIYIVIQLLAATIIYSQLRKFSKEGALVAALLWGIYTPYNIGALGIDSCRSTPSGL